MTFITDPTRTSTTEDKYESIYKGLEKHVRRKEKLPPDASVQPASVALFFNENEGNWMPATCRLYRAAITHVVKRKQADGDEWASGALLVLSHVDDGEEERISRQDDLRRKRKALRSGKRRGPGQKVKRLSKQDARLLVEELYKMRTPYGKKTATWFISAMLTGLRPSEWEFAKFETNYQMVKVLVIENAKNSNGRAHGKHRRLPLTHATEDQLRVIESHMKEVWGSVEAGDFERFYTNCRQTLNRAADKLWPYRKQHPALYTARHMFAADIKGVFDQISVAAMMGHASIDTAGQHYAPAWSGRGGMAVEPSEQDVQAVTFLNQSKIDKAAEKAAEQQAQIGKLVDTIPKVNGNGGGNRGGSK
jgi:integrase